MRFWPRRRRAAASHNLNREPLTIFSHGVAKEHSPWRKPWVQHERYEPAPAGRKTSSHPAKGMVASGRSASWRARFLSPLAGLGRLAMAPVPRLTPWATIFRPLCGLSPRRQDCSFDKLR
jgi:hypothetical protein